MSAPRRAAATSTSPGLRSVTFPIQLPSATSSTRRRGRSAPIASSAPKISLTPSPTRSRPAPATSVSSRWITAGSSAVISPPSSSAIARAIGPDGPRRLTPSPPSARTPCVRSAPKRRAASSGDWTWRTPAAARSPRLIASICALWSADVSRSGAAPVAVSPRWPAARFPSLTALKSKPSCRSPLVTCGGALTTADGRSFTPRIAAPAVAAATASAAVSRSSPCSGGRRPISARNSSSRKSASARSRSYSPMVPPSPGSCSGASRSMVINPCPAKAAS